MEKFSSEISGVPTVLPFDLQLSIFVLPLWLSVILSFFFGGCFFSYGGYFFFSSSVEQVQCCWCFTGKSYLN